MMQNIRNGKPVVFTHECPSERKGKVMSHDEYETFLYDMVYKCFSFAELNLVRLPKADEPKGLRSLLFKKKQVSPIYRLPSCLGGDGYCDFVIAKSVQEFDDLCFLESSDFENTYTKDNGNWLKVIGVNADNVDHPGECINGDRYTIQIFTKNMYPKQENKPITNPLSDNNIVHQVGEAWRTLDTDVLAPYLDKDLHYSSDFVFTEISSREEYLEYLTGKFDALREEYSNNIKVKYGINSKDNTNKLNGVYIKIGEEESVAYLEVACENGRIIQMIMHESKIDPFSTESYVMPSGKDKAYLEREPLYIDAKFSFEKYDDDFQELNKIAYDSLNQYFDSLGIEYGHDWSWMQTYPQPMSFQHLCISYKSYVLCIIIGLHRIKNGQGEMLVDDQFNERLLSECEKYNLTPCIFLIDCADGSPCSNKLNLIDARTHEKIVLEELKEDNRGGMSAWEINNLGVRYACDYLRKQGITIISYCDVIGIYPQIWFERDGERCYAFVRSIPAGLSKEKYEITKDLMVKYEKYNGYFFDVQWNNMLGNNGNFQDKYLSRKSNPWNLVHRLDIKPIEDAIKEYDFIEIVEGESYDIK